MFNFPTLPTDSFYKFLFVAGVIMVVLGLYLDGNFEENQYNATWKLGISRAVKKDSLNAVDHIITKYLDSVQKEQIAFVKKKHLPMPLIFDTHDPLENKYLNLLFSKQTALQNDSIYLSNQLIIEKNKYEQLHDNIVFLIFFGLFVSVFGGFAWYFKIQKFQDELLKLQVEEARKSFPKKYTGTGRKHYDPINVKRK